MSCRPIRSHDLQRLLAARHSKDVWVPECQNGPSIGGTHLRLDGWAMKRSWANPLTIGYEIKVSRSDFVNDNKWHSYLGLCNELYFVSPRKIVGPDELPPEVGLLWSSKNATRLYTKKKAQRREVEIPEDLWRYLLICRARIHNGRDHDSAARWRLWLQEKQENRQLGYEVSRAIREHVLRVEQENRDLRRKQEVMVSDYTKIRDLLESMGVDPDGYMPDQRLREAMQEQGVNVPPRMVHAIRRAQNDVACVHQWMMERAQEQER